MSIASIILAAGRSSRMDDKFKPLLKLENSTFIEHIIFEHRAAGIDNIVVVTGFYAEKLSPLLIKCKVAEALNPTPERGMFSSVKTGIESLPPVDAFFIHPVDIPLIKKSTLSLLISRFLETLPELLHPVYKNHRGHPPLVNGSLVDDIIAFDGDGGLRSFFRTLEDIQECNCADAGILRGINTPEEYYSFIC